MRERHHRLNRRVGFAAGGAAAAIVCLAGSALSVAQGQTGAASAIRNPMAQPSGSGLGTEKVKVDEHMIVDLHVNDEDLSNILQMLSLQSQRSILSSRNVSASVTANLYGVTFYEALDAILHVNGYGYIERGNFIYVYTLDELKTIHQAQRTRIWRVMSLNYLNAIDAAEFVKPLLSEQGQIKTNGRPISFSETGVLTGEDFANESTMLIFDYEENLGEIEAVLAALDTRPSQVLIEATILQTALTEANAFGVDFSLIGDMDFFDFVGGPLRAVDAMIGGEAPPGRRGQGVVSSVGNAGGPSTFKVGIVHNDIAAFLRVLDEVSDTTILSRPNLLILNRAVGRVLVGRKVGYLSTTSTDTATTQTVEFLDTGTQLIVRPFISRDGMIRMELKPKVSEAVIRNATTAGGQAVTIPDEISNELTTTVLVRDGQTIVLGGLFRESTQATRRQIPFVGDLPIIGAAFRGHEDDVDRNEVIFMITPTIMADNILLEQGRRAESMVEHVRTGSRQGLLFFSREKRTQQMLVQARELAAQGKREQAIYKVNRALRLNPNQADALAMREALLQERTVWPVRSMQHEIISGEIERLGEIQGVSAPQPAAPKKVSRSMPKVEVDAGEGVAWFDDDDEGQNEATGQESPSPFEVPAPSTEQAAAPVSPLSSAVPAKKSAVQEVPAKKEPTTSTPLASTVQPDPSVEASATTIQAIAPAATPQPSATRATKPEAKQPAATPVAASPAQTPEVQPEPTPAQASKTEAAKPTAQATSVTPATGVSSESTTVAAMTPATVTTQPQAPATMQALRANSSAGDATEVQSPVWSSALATALEEAGGLEALTGQTAEDEPQWIVADGVDFDGWDVASELKPGEGVLAVFNSFQTIWEMFNTYASRTPGPGSSVTSVPTEQGERK